MRGASFRLDRGERVIGRDAGVDVPLTDGKVSRRHATLTVGEGTVVLADTGSMNGTWLNGERLTEPQALRDGDRIRIGHVELRFFDPATAATVPMGNRFAPIRTLTATAATAPTQVGPVRLAPAGVLAPTAPLGAVSRLAGRTLWATAGLLAVAGLALAYLVLR